MAVDTMEMDAPQVDEQQTPQPDPVEKYYNYLKRAGADVAPSLDSFKKTLSNDSTAQKYYNYLRQNKFDAPPTYGSFARTLGVKQAGTPTSAPTPPATLAAPPVPEHEVQHDPIQDIRHVKEMADRPISGTTLVTGPYYDPNAKVGNAEEVAQTKAYTAQYDKMANDLGTQWGAKPEVVKQVLNDFPDEQNQDKLKANAQLAKDNPVSYGRLKNANDIRIGIAQDGPNGIHDANVFNHLLDATDYDQLTSENIPYQIQLMREHNMGQADIEKLKTAQRPLINSTDPGLLQKYWTSSDKELGLSPDEYAGLETERLFNPNKAAMDMASLKHARGIGEDGKANPLDMSTQPYEYQRGIENIKYNLQNTGRDNLQRYIVEHKGDIDKQVSALKDDYQARINAAAPQEQQQLIQEFQDHPIVQEANRLEDAQQGLQYSESEDKRRYPLNFADQATRAVSEAMDKTAGFGSNVATLGGNVLQGAGETSDNTIRFVKNMAINILGSDESKAFNNAKDIGHQSLTELAAYEPTSYTGTESPILVPRETQQAVQNILNGPGTDEEKQQKAISYISDNFADLKANPKAGQQNITGKAALFQAANVMGQILGVANQSFLLGGVIGDASKLQQMATAFTPMYMSTQNQMYEQALQRGDEHPLLKSNIDATILSLASLINPDIKVVKGMVGAESGVGKMIAGIDESTWNKVLSENKPLVDRMIGAAKATGRQLGLANLQYGVIAPVAQYAAHKSILDEDANLGDMIKDAVVQTSISMALPSLLHGVWGGKSATEVNPQQKFAIVEAGLHPDQNIDLIESKIKAGTMPEIQGHEMKQLIKHAGEILQNSEMVKTDGTPMNEKEVADNVYSMLRKAVLEKKLKTAAEPIKPIIEDQIHEVNKEIADLHTADPNKADLNQLLHDNLDKIDQKNPLLANIIKQHIAANEPEAFFRTIANEVKTENGKENGDVGKIEEKYGKPLVDKAIELSKQKSTTNGEKINNNAQPEGQVVQPKERAETIATDKGAPSIRSTAEFRTWNLGDMEGKPEDEAAKKHLEGVVEKWDQHPAGETGGEPFGKFVDRVIPAFDKVLKEGDDNTTIVTHSSVLKAMRVWDEMGRPDVENLTPEQKKTFADKYNETETHNGDLETFKGDKGDIHVIRHGQTEDNEKNNFRSGDTPLTQKGVQDAAVAGQELKDKTGGNVPQIITSDLPRTIHSSNIINDALQKPSAESVFQHTSEGIGSEGSERSGVEQSQQGEALSEESAPTQSDSGEIPATEPRTAGIAERVKNAREKEKGVKAPEPGKVETTQELVDLGRKLIKGGADPEDAVSGYEKDKQISTERMSIVRARAEELAKIRDKAEDQHGEGSEQEQAASKEESDWLARIQPMQTEWSRIGRTQMGETDLDTGTVTSIKRAFKEVSGKPLTETQAQQAEDFHAKLQEHEKTISGLQVKIDELMNKLQESEKGKGVKEKAKDLAKKIRDNAKLNRPGMFSAATPASLVWDTAVEVVAKSIEAGGAIAEAIGKGIDHIKESDWYKGLSEAKQKQAVKQFEDWHKDETTGKVDIKTHFVDKKDNNFTPNESKAIWEHTKEILKTSEKTDFHDVIGQVAMDTGLNAEQVRRAIAEPKGAKVVTDKMYAEMYRRNQILNSAKAWVKSANQSAERKFWNKVIKLPSAIITFGHGSVAPITHVGTDLFRPSNWKSYFNFMLDSYVYSFGGLTDKGKARYEQAMGDLVRDPMFLTAKKAGLKIDPTDLSGDDYSKYQGVFHKISKMGERGFNAMKPYRLEQFKKIYNGLSDQAKADDDVIKTIAKMVNLSSGTTNVKIPEGTDAVLFAPKLVTSQYQRIFTEPTKAAITFAKWGTGHEVTDAQKLQAKMVARHAGEMMATYLTLLAANQAILSMSGSKQKINFSDPLGPDWMKFKVLGKDVDASGGMNSSLRFVTSLGKEVLRANGVIKTDEKASPGDSEGRKILKQFTNKLSPFAGDIAEVASGTDVMGHPLPWSAVKPSAGREKLTWGNFVEGKLPIPLAEGFKAFHDAAKEKGMSAPVYKKLLEGITIGILTGTTGAKISTDTGKKKASGGRGTRGG